MSVAIGLYCYLESLDDVKPVIKSITVDNSKWLKIKNVVITGTENYCKSVNVKVIDESDNILFEKSGSVSNNSYSVSGLLELEAGINGKSLKVIVTDSCGNSTEQKFTISKIDGVAPEVTSTNKIIEGWAKEKNITFTATDQGIGNIQIAFNNISDYSLAVKEEEIYSKEYKLVGDVYKPRKARVFYKDELGNVSIKEVTIDKIDNTAPSITETRFDNNKLNITAHDKHKTEGEGSGVSKYRFITSTEKLENPEITEENSTEVLVNENIVIPEIYKVKYVYIVAEDLVGNISNVYEAEVPQLKLTSKVNVSGNNGKGVVELDWSNYDISNKYFVIYRKQENQSDWETIVSLDEKFNGSSYIDNLGNDNKNPSELNINIKGKQETNSIEITPTTTDNGTKYEYYIESYDITTMGLLNRTKAFTKTN